MQEIIRELECKDNQNKRQINKYQNMRAWTNFKDDWEQDRKRDIQQETKSKIFTRKTKIKMQMMVRKDVTQKEGKT